MDNSSNDKQARAMAASTIGRDFQWVTFTGIISNLVTLYIVSIGTEALLATSTMIVTTAIFVFLAGNNQLDNFANWIADMDETEAASHSGKAAQVAPFAFWKAVYSLCFIAVAVAQLYNLWT
ncbi:MAG: hypothetical protein GY881_13255 [Gammaproteobacteria bacterium]|nr:hypothetical protein [Gammaproteobacteria bacterium]MCP4881668.1 hypothetical protein [Gammaproteobacteria bacterium]